MDFLYLKKYFELLVFSWLILLFFSACNFQNETNSSKKDLIGLWCDGSFNCIFFQEQDCFLRRIAFDSYQIKNKKIQINRPDTMEQYPYYLQGTDTLNINFYQKSPWKKYFKSTPINQKEIIDIQYSQLTPDDSFTLSINKNYEVILEIDFHRFLEPGQYKNKLDPNYIAFLKELIRGMSLEISNDLNPEIYSDIQEWAAIFKIQNQPEQALFYNYKGLNINHTYFASFMSFLPLLSGFEKVSLDRKENQALSFRKKEFERNILLYKNH